MRKNKKMDAKVIQQFTAIIVLKKSMIKEIPTIQ